MTLQIPLRAKIFVKIALSRTVFRDKCIFAFYVEIQNGHQKWRENNFWPKLAAESADTLLVVGIPTLSPLSPEYKTVFHKGRLIPSKNIQTKFDILSK